MMKIGGATASYRPNSTHVESEQRKPISRTATLTDLQFAIEDKKATEVSAQEQCVYEGP